jgi:hypothetical protein
MKRVISLFVLCVFMATTSYAYWGWGGDRHDRYEYRGGHYWLGGAIVGGLALGALVMALDHPRVVVVNGYQYYYDGNYYYTQTPNGYVVVQPPVIVQPAPVVVAAPQPVVVQEVAQPVIIHSVPKEFEPVQWRGQTYFVRGNKWFVNTEKGLVEVPDPLK